MATAVAALSTVIKEEIAQGLREMRIKIDPAVWGSMISTSKGVTSEGLGRDWKFLYTFATGLSGAYQFEASTVRDGASLTLDTVSGGIFGEGNGFPGRLESTAPAFHQTTVQLKEARGNLFVPLKWLQMDQFDASVGSAVKDLLKGAAKKAAVAHAIAMFTSDNDNFPIITVGTAGSVSGASHVLTIDNSNAADETGRIAMCHNGMLVDFWDVSSSPNFVTLNSVPWMITKVDYINNKCTVVATDGTESIALASGDQMVLRNSRSAGSGGVGNQPSGFNSWIKNSGTISALNLNLANYPEFGSLIVAESGPATEKMLTKHIGTFYDRIGTMCDLDTILSSAGIVHGYLQNEDNLVYYERNGKRLSIKGGFTGVDYAYESNEFNWGISTYIEPNALYVVKLGEQNLKEYVPPSVPGEGSHTNFDNEFKFVAQLGGATGVFLHERTTSATVNDQLEAPYWRICEYAPDCPQSIKLTGLDSVESN